MSLAPAYRALRARKRPRTPEQILRAGLGNKLLYWWEPRAPYVTLTGTDVDVMAPMHGGVSFVRSSGTFTWNASGGPNNRPFISYGTAGAYLLANPLGISAGNRVAMVVVGKLGTTNNTHIAGASDNFPIGNSSFQFGRSSAGTVRYYRDDDADGMNGAFLNTATAADTDWHTFAQAPLSTGCEAILDFSTIDTFASSTPNIAIAIGYLGNSSAEGAVAAVFLVNAASDWTKSEAALQVYMRSRFGI